jgi:hypothetical protein
MGNLIGAFFEVRHRLGVVWQMNIYLRSHRRLSKYGK